MKFEEKNHHLVLVILNEKDNLFLNDCLIKLYVKELHLVKNDAIVSPLFKM